MKQLLLIILVLLLGSCAQNDEVKECLEDIKQIGNANPILAMEMLDSVKLSIRQPSEYVNMKSQLLEIRLQDKADVVPTSDAAIVALIPYFETNGTMQDIQEVYYYVGSTYRDLQDTPRAIEYFLRSLSICDDNNGCDSVLLRNTYSNLHCLYYSVQDYDNALDMALKEYEQSIKINDLRVTSILHVAASYMHQCKTKEAIQYLDIAFQTYMENDSRGDVHSLYLMLINYSCLQEKEKAKKCHHLMTENLDMAACINDDTFCLAMGHYFMDSEQWDSAEHYLKNIINNGNLTHKYDATRHLFYIKVKQQKMTEACQYAEMFITVSDSLNLASVKGRRQR